MADESLRVTAGPATGGVISPGDVFTIGRAEGGVGALADDPEISRQHARISRTATGELVVEDLGSTNGTFVNGQRISEPTTLHDGDSIAVGKTTLEFSGGTPPPPPTPAPPDIASAGTVLVQRPEAAPTGPEPPSLEPPTPPPPPPVAEAATEPPAPPPLAPPEPSWEPPAAEPPEPEPEPPEPEPEPDAEPEPGLEGPVPMYVLDYLRAQRTLTLATAGDDGPWATTLTYVNRGGDIYVCARDDSNTARHLRDSSTVGYAIDEYTSDGRKIKGLQGRGECSPVEDADRADAVDLFDDKFPDLRVGTASDLGFYKLAASTIEYHDTTRSADDGAEYHTEAPVIPPYED